VGRRRRKLRNGKSLKKLSEPAFTISRAKRTKSKPCSVRKRWRTSGKTFLSEPSLPSANRISHHCSSSVTVNYVTKKTTQSYIISFRLIMEPTTLILKLTSKYQTCAADLSGRLMSNKTEIKTPPLEHIPLTRVWKLETKLAQSKMKLSTLGESKFRQFLTTVMVAKMLVVTLIQLASQLEGIKVAVITKNCGILISQGISLKPEKKRIIDTLLILVEDMNINC